MQNAELRYIPILHSAFSILHYPTVPSGFRSGGGLFGSSGSVPGRRGAPSIGGVNPSSGRSGSLFLSRQPVSIKLISKSNARKIIDVRFIFIVKISFHKKVINWDLS
jgi:hypothetical protein